MLSDVQNRHIRKIKKFAKKNILCKYIATILIVCSILIVDLIRHQKRTIIGALQLASLCIVFLFCTSFTPPVFHEEQPQETEMALESEPSGESMDQEQIEESIKSQPLLEEDKAGLEELIAKSEELDVQPASDSSTDDAVFHKDDWNLLLVNKQHTIPSDYTFSLGTIKGNMQCDERIIEPLTSMFAAAKEDGINLVVCSPYRDMARQEYLFDRKMKKYMNEGYSYMEAYKTASVTVTVPGASEHQVGLAMDIISDSYSRLDEGFGETAAGKWLMEHGAEYGFILRYPLGKEEITGIQYEPWHYRYVGKEAAVLIMEKNITLEEFVENL